MKAQTVSLTSMLLALVLLIGTGQVGAAEGEILINRLFAERLAVKPGDVVELSASGDRRNVKKFRVKAIYQEKADPYQVPLKRSTLKMHISDLQELLGKSDEVDLISIRVRKNATTLAARLNSEAIGFQAYSAQELARRTSTTFEVVSRFHRAIAFITMLAGAIFIFALMVMRVEDQRKNLAILSVTGISKKTILKTLLLESTLFAFLASILGSAIGFVAATAVNLYYRNFYQTQLVFAQVTTDILVQAILVSFALGIIAGTFSWFRLRRIALLQELGR